MSIYVCGSCDLYIPDEHVIYDDEGLPTCPECDEYLTEYEEYDGVSIKKKATVEA